MIGFLTGQAIYSVFRDKSIITYARLVLNANQGLKKVFFQINSFEIFALVI
jgi:hypothetical protein